MQVLLMKNFSYHFYFICSLKLQSFELKKKELKYFCLHDFFSLTKAVPDKWNKNSIKISNANLNQLSNASYSNIVN